MTKRTSCASRASYAFIVSRLPPFIPCQSYTFVEFPRRSRALAYACFVGMVLKSYLIESRTDVCFHWPPRERPKSGGKVLFKEKADSAAKTTCAISLASHLVLLSALDLSSMHTYPLAHSPTATPFMTSHSSPPLIPSPHSGSISQYPHHAGYDLQS